MIEKGKMETGIDDPDHFATTPPNIPRGRSPRTISAVAFQDYAGEDSIKGFTTDDCVPAALRHRINKLAELNNSYDVEHEQIALIS